MNQVSGISAAWDAEYSSGRYGNEPPVPFVSDIFEAAVSYEIVNGLGLYVGCGNGRNYLPLTRRGLNLLGLDVSAVALQHLAERAPELRGRLIHGDLSSLPPGKTFDLVIGIQVFQHGDRATAHEALRKAQQKLNPGGLFCLRVNAVGTDLWPAHELTEDHPDGGFTIRYLSGPKSGLLIHFFGAEELSALFSGHFEQVVALRREQAKRTPPAPGQWSQWEAIWHKKAG